MPSQLERLESHAGHLLDAFLVLRERYAMLRPMLFDARLKRVHASVRQRRGFKTLRLSLFLGCAQDIAKLTLDRDSGTPSVVNIVSDLSTTAIADQLRDRFAHWILPSIESESDPDVVEALQRIQSARQSERRSEFDTLLNELTDRSDVFLASPHVKAFHTVRDKISAHTEIRCVADKYQLYELGSLGLKWTDLDQSICEMQRLVELIGLVVRNAGFAWDRFDTQLTSAASAFWEGFDAAG